MDRRRHARHFTARSSTYASTYTVYERRRRPHVLYSTRWIANRIDAGTGGRPVPRLSIGGACSCSPPHRAVMQTLSRPVTSLCGSALHCIHRWVCKLAFQQLPTDLFRGENFLMHYPSPSNWFFLIPQSYFFIKKIQAHMYLLLEK